MRIKTITLISSSLILLIITLVPPLKVNAAACPTDIANSGCRPGFENCHGYACYTDGLCAKPVPECASYTCVGWGVNKCLETGVTISDSNCPACPSTHPVLYTQGPPIPLCCTQGSAQSKVCIVPSYSACSSGKRCSIGAGTSGGCINPIPGTDTYQTGYSPWPKISAGPDEAVPGSKPEFRWDDIVAPGVPSRPDMLSNITNTALALLTVFGVVAAMAYLIYSGIRWVTSGGDKQQLESAKQGLTYAIIGLIVIIASAAIINVVGNLLGISFGL